MGHSVQLVGDRHSIFNDLDLMLVLLIMAERVQTHQPRFANLLPHAADWARSVEQRAPGVIQPGLETIIHDPEAVEQLPSLLTEVESMVRAFGDSIRIEVQKARWPLPGASLDKPVPVLRVLATLTQIRRLFEA